MLHRRRSASQLGALTREAIAMDLLRGANPTAFVDHGEPGRSTVDIANAFRCYNITSGRRG
jgi:hypothetical protein